MNWVDLEKYFVRKGFTEISYIYNVDIQEEIIHLVNPSTKERINLTIEFC